MNQSRGPRALPRESFPWLVDGQAKRVIKCFRERYQSFENSAESNDRGSKLPPPNFTPVISIMGVRGSGKSSALLTLMEELKEGNEVDLILDRPLDPHRFLQGDMTINWLLAAIKRHMDSESEKKCGNYRSHMCNKGCPYLDAGRRDHQQGSCGASNDLAMCYERLVDRVRQAFQLPTSGEMSHVNGKFRQVYLERSLDFPGHMNAFIRCLTDAHASPSSRRKEQPMEYPPLLIASIDDADLVPEYLEDILVFLRLISQSVHRLVLIITLDEALALKSRVNHYVDNMFKGLIGVRDSGINRSVIRVATDMAGQFVAKFMPYEARFRLAPISLKRRLDFRPESYEDTTISRKSFGGATTPRESLGDLLVMDENLGLKPFFTVKDKVLQGKKRTSSFSYAVILPDNPRLLEEAYYLLLRHKEGIKSSNEQPSPNSVVLEKCRDTLLALAELFFVSPYAGRYPIISEVVRISEVSTDEDTVIEFSSSAFKHLNYRPSFSSEEMAVGGWTLYSHGGFRPEMTLEDGIGQEHFAPDALTYGYLMLQESLREANGKNQAGNSSFPFRFARPLHNTFFHAVPELDIGSDAVASNAFRWIYPLTLHGNSKVFGFPLPPWSAPSRLLDFCYYWNEFLEIFTFIEGSATWTRDKKSLALVRAWIWIVIGMSGRPESLDFISTDKLLDMDSEFVTGGLRKAYESAVKNSDSAFSCWVERGLYGLAIAEHSQLFPHLGNSGISRDNLENKVICAVARDLNFGPDKIGSVKSEINEKANNYSSEVSSVLLKYYQDHICMMGPSSGRSGEEFGGPDRDFK